MQNLERRSSAAAKNEVLTFVRNLCTQTRVDPLTALQIMRIVQESEVVPPAVLEIIERSRVERPFWETPIGELVEDFRTSMAKVRHKVGEVLTR